MLCTMKHDPIFWVSAATCVVFAILRFIVPVNGKVEIKDVPATIRALIAGTAAGVWLMLLREDRNLYVYGILSLFLVIISPLDFIKPNPTDPPLRTLSVTAVYKDLAHLFVGFLIGASIIRPAYWWLAGILTVIEVIAFLWRRK